MICPHCGSDVCPDAYVGEGDVGSPFFELFRSSDKAVKLIRVLFEHEGVVAKADLTRWLSSDDTPIRADYLRELVQRARARCEPHRVLIPAAYGVGYFINAEGKARLQAALSEAV